MKLYSNKVKFHNESKSGLRGESTLLTYPKAGYIKYLAVWVPFELTLKNLMDQILVSLSKHKVTEAFRIDMSGI